MMVILREIVCIRLVSRKPSGTASVELVQETRSQLAMGFFFWLKNVGKMNVDCPSPQHFYLESFFLIVYTNLSNIIPE